MLTFDVVYRISQIQSLPAVDGEPFYSRKQHALIRLFAHRFTVLFMVMLIS